MATVQVLNQKAEATSTVELEDSIFDCEVREHLFYDVVRMQLGKRRSATASTKTRSEVAGGGRKPYRQKGTGRARQGSISAPHYRGGGVVFGPNGRKFNLSLNKKTRRAALKSALSLRNQGQKLIVLDELTLAEFKTKSFIDVVKALGLGKALFVIGEQDEKVMNSSRNLRSCKVLPAEGLNVYDILNHEHLVITLPAVERIEQRLKS